LTAAVIPQQTSGRLSSPEASTFSSQPYSTLQSQKGETLSYETKEESSLFGEKRAATFPAHLTDHPVSCVLFFFNVSQQFPRSYWVRMALPWGIGSSETRLSLTGLFLAFRSAIASNATAAACVVDPIYCKILLFHPCRDQFDKFLLERDFEEAEHVTATINAFFGDFIDNSMQTAKASALKGSFKQAEQLERGANVAKIHLRNLRGKVDPRLTERIETILWESEQERVPLEAAKVKAVEKSRFAVAREASINLRELTERYRRRIMIAYKTAITAAPVGTSNLSELAA